MTPTLTYDPTKIILSIAILSNQLIVSQRFFQRIKVGPLHILNNRDLQRGPIVNIAYDNRDLMQARQLRRSPSALASNNLVAISNRSNNNWLNNAMLTNGAGEILKIVLIKLSSRVSWIWPHMLYRNQSVRIDAAGR